MRIDLHAHSSASDGTDTPAEVVRAAARAGLDVVALTDHDTSAGWAEAAEAALEVGITLVRGMEISTRLDGQGVHLLAYLPDPRHPGLAAQLEVILRGRDSRLPEMCARLAGLGHPVTVDDVRRAAGGGVPGRPHVADALVAAGAVADRQEAFERFLAPGRPAYVRRHAPTPAEMVAAVRDAGGVSVLAHPWGRGARTVLRPEVLAGLADLGLAGLEVDHQDHPEQTRAELRGLARDLDLVVTGSSDYHGTGKVDHDLGVHTTHPDAYARLLALADEAAAASGRAAPTVVEA